MLLSVVSRMTALLLVCGVQQAYATDQTKDPGLIAKLNMAATQLDRLALLKDDEKDWTFTFTDKQPFYNFAPGGVINMNAATFPAARGNGLTLAMLNLGPCSQLPVHLHPRASNYVVAVLGNTTTYMFEENGARTVKTTLTPGKGTIFPQGAMHTMVNNGCDNAQLVSALSSDDAGTLNLGNVFTNGFPADLINAAFGSEVITPLSSAKMPGPGTGASWGTAECLKRCGITPSQNQTGTTSRRYYQE